MHQRIQRYPWHFEWGTNNIRLPDRWRHLGSGGWRVRKLSVVCLHNNAIVARCILDTNIALWATRTTSAPSILLVLLEPHCYWRLNQRRQRAVLIYDIFLVYNSLFDIIDCTRRTFISSTSLVRNIWPCTYSLFWLSYEWVVGQIFRTTTNSKALLSQAML